MYNTYLYLSWRYFVASRRMMLHNYLEYKQYGFAVRMSMLFENINALRICLNEKKYAK